MRDAAAAADDDDDDVGVILASMGHHNSLFTSEGCICNKMVQNFLSYFLLLFIYLFYFMHVGRGFPVQCV